MTARTERTRAARPESLDEAVAEHALPSRHGVVVPASAYRPGNMDPHDVHG